MLKSGKQFFTSESVTEGHPDKIADNISDAVLDAALEQDMFSRVACETLITTGFVLVAGEIRTKGFIDFQKIVRETIKDIGYDSSEKGFDYKSCGVNVAIDEQSPDIAQGVDEGVGFYLDQGAGDQGLMFGYANNETDVLMPLPVHLSHKLTAKLASVRKSGDIPYLLPDGKSQVTVEYEGGKVKRIDAVVISSQHKDHINHKDIVEDIKKNVIEPSIPGELLDKDTKYFINPTGRFVIGGPMGDCGLTGRKIIVDTYGGMGRHGGGCFSGKDPSKVDRSGAYAARYIAKNLVAAEICSECEVQLSYAIGYSKPISVHINTFGTGQVDPVKLEKAVFDLFPLTPSEIIRKLDLLRPIYKPTASYGHFGRNHQNFTWEKTDLAESVKKALS